ncbi:N-acetylgalactosamine-N,N'-diacetylbacillosaminyl-diphospho-undecaprenol 4-alpha-N-acetylgalactosaminyltransferase [Gimesia alba]|uniref:N-acetylgalactosamine-N, N'-diacetylbacillosaminyl-diphospho-undecaprenol 4-alpha-N-acetylgalactosaminyltransferase n=1 Tax=Gimesia alba TaxID=2527973 RepID=A0A517RFQ7_9PLAN|nr:glycosyltransferase [Gimesia alba]QDT42709.1 N-acetylgalactosamine-N,N'-diacetylbacillosaminyl-diphospho-undecaprenol 4-alpha-N-acetylgalactosaminyltransferase [Gimesia alba]
MTKKIRILFAIGSLGGGGAERVLLDQLARLDRDQFTPLLYLVSHSGSLLEELPEDVPVYAFSSRNATPRWNWPGRIHRQLVSDLARVIQEQQVDLVFDHTFHMTLIAGPATRKTKTPRLSLIVCDPEQDLTNSESRFLFFKKRLLQQAYHSADTVIAVSEGVRQAAIAYYDLDPALVQTFYNPVNLERIDALYAQGDLRLDLDKFHVVSCGRLHPQKGFGYLLEAAEKLIYQNGLTDLRFHILGEGPSREELQRQIKQRRLGEAVLLEGFQDNPFQYYREAQLFCLPSLYEGFGLVLAEAMACRIPVLSTDCPSGPAEILENGKYGRLVPPANADALADQIADAVSDYEAWQTLVPAARERVETMFDAGAVMRKFESLFERIAAK